MRRHGQRREQILEDRDIPGAGRDLGRVLGAGARRQRVVVGRRQERAVLPVAGIRDPFSRGADANADADSAHERRWLGDRRVDFAGDGLSARRAAVPARRACAARACASTAFTLVQRGLQLLETVAAGGRGSGCRRGNPLQWDFRCPVGIEQPVGLLIRVGELRVAEAGQQRQIRAPPSGCIRSAARTLPASSAVAVAPGLRCLPRQGDAAELGQHQRHVGVVRLLQAPAAGRPDAPA